MGAYKFWCEIKKHFPKSSRSLSSKIDSGFLELFEALFKARYQKDKLMILEESDIKLSMLKFFLRLSWETKALDNKKYILLSEKIDEVGRMLGGWKKYSSKQTSAK